MSGTKQNRGIQIAAFAAILGAGTVFGTYAMGAAAVRFDPFAPTRADTSLSTLSVPDPTPSPPTPGPVPSGTRPPIRDPFRPPSRSPFTP